MEESSLLTLLQKRPHEGIDAAIYGVLLLHCEKQAVGISTGGHRGMCE